MCAGRARTAAADHQSAGSVSEVAGTAGGTGQAVRSTTTSAARSAPGTCKTTAATSLDGP